MRNGQKREREGNEEGKKRLERDRHIIRRHPYHQETHNGCLSLSLRHTASIRDIVLHHGKPARAEMEGIL